MRCSRFRSTLTELRELPAFPPEVIREEPGQCRVACCDATRAGPIHEAFVESLPSDWRADSKVEIFSRLLWLKDGWYPAAMGFHLDWAQLAGTRGRVETLVANFGGCSFTEFVDDAFELPSLPHLPERERLDEWGGQIEAMVENGKLRTRSLQEGVLARFDDHSWHRPRPAVSTGWRLLVRAIRGLREGRRYAERGGFTCIRNDYRPDTPEEALLYAPYRS